MDMHIMYYLKIGNDKVLMWNAAGAPVSKVSAVERRMCNLSPHCFILAIAMTGSSQLLTACRQSKRRMVQGINCNIGILLKTTSRMFSMERNQLSSMYAATFTAQGTASGDPDMTSLVAGGPHHTWICYTGSRGSMEIQSQKQVCSNKPAYSF